MDHRVRLILAITVAGFAVLSACNKSRDRINPLDPLTTVATQTPVPGTQIIWKNGNFGSALGRSISIQAYSFQTVSPIALTDGISGDTVSLRLSGTASSSYFNIYLPLSACIPLGEYPFLTTGYVRFDIRLEKPAAQFSTLQCAGIAGPYNLNPATYNTSTFSHVDVPMSSLWTTASPGVCVALNLYVNMTGAVTGPILTISNLQWTRN